MPRTSSEPRRGPGRPPSPYGSRLLGRANQSPRALRVRVQLLLTGFLVLTNLIGAGIVIALIVLVRPSGGTDPDFLLAEFIAVPVYVALAVVVGVLVGTRSGFVALDWAYRGREATDEDRLRTLRLPRVLTLAQAGLWAIATGLFSGLARLLDPPLFTTMLLAVGIAGVVTSAVAYLISEFVLRPVAARALESGLSRRSRGSGVRRRMIMFWAIGTGVPVAGSMAVAVLALVDDELTRNRLAVVGLVLGGVVLVFGLLITVLNARAVVAPLLAVRAGLERVESGTYGEPIAVYDGTELGQLQAGFNRMTAGLSDRERIRDLFGRHVGEDVAAAAMDAEVELGGEVRTVSVLFVDLKGSTTLATQLPPEEVVEVLNRFCAVVVTEVDRQRGLVNKFMGDAVLAVFGAPVVMPDHATRALRAARVIVDRLRDELPEIDAGVGVATGEVLAGNVGDQHRFEYTVIGDAVNTAARLTELAKSRSGRLVAAAASVEAADADEQERWREDGDAELRGRQDATALAVPR